jgi:poly(3-hydroxybutyrate) depolymerase
MATRLPTNVPGELPAAYEPTRPAAVRTDDDLQPPASAAGETRKLKLAEFKESCQVYEPSSLAGRAPGVLIWLHAPGEDNAEEVIRAWQPICDRDSLVLVVPSAADASRWERTELEYLRRLAERVIRQYKPDPRRVVVFGRGGGGAMAWLLGLSSRDLFRGIATSAAPLPRQIRVPENEPAARLAIFAGLSADDAIAAQIVRGLDELADAGYPVSTITAADGAGRLSDSQREELARWIDSLDRF